MVVGHDSHVASVPEGRYIVDHAEERNVVTDAGFARD